LLLLLLLLLLLRRIIPLTVVVLRRRLILTTVVVPPPLPDLGAEREASDPTTANGDPSSLYLAARADSRRVPGSIPESDDLSTGVDVRASVVTTGRGGPPLLLVIITLFSPAPP